ncbi:ArsR/SmtB family transcription factor [Streptomyces sp. NPDC048434]|uniref:ArsR/SmtB family transcription factor n=1 Tax=Streptomyces sp. NPDC048434 TaxID=3365549 RepID=UPI003716E9F6
MRFETSPAAPASGGGGTRANRARTDVERRATTMATEGLATALDSLHPAIACRSSTLYLADPRILSLTTSRPLRLFPSGLAGGWLLSVDPWDERGPYLVYPATGQNTRARTGKPSATQDPDLPFADVIGHSRLRLLTDLHLPRTTTELARRHFMSASTVSYHLSRLHRAGLLTRTRSAHRVHYRRTPQADQLLQPAEDPPSAGHASAPSAVVSV